MELRGATLLALVFVLHTSLHGAVAQQSPRLPPPPAAAAQTNESDELAAYTRGLLVQNLTVLGQVLRIPTSLFRNHRCQVGALAGSLYRGGRSAACALLGRPGGPVRTKRARSPRATIRTALS